MFLELAAAGVGFELIYGGINDIQGRAFGHLTLALTGIGCRDRRGARADRALAST